MKYAKRYKCKYCSRKYVHATGYLLKHLHKHHPLKRPVAIQLFSIPKCR